MPLPAFCCIRFPVVHAHPTWEMALPQYLPLSVFLQAPLYFGLPPEEDRYAAAEILQRLFSPLPPLLQGEALPLCSLLPLFQHHD